MHPADHPVHLLAQILERQQHLADLVGAAVTDANPARMAVNRIGFITLLLWPLAAWRSPTPLDEERHRLRWMLTLSWAVLLVYVMLARGAPHPQALQLLQDELRLDRLVIGATLMVQFSIWRNRRRTAGRRAEFLAFHDAGRALSRPGQVQAGQRHPWSCAGRPAAARGGRAHARQPGRGRQCLSPVRRRVHGHRA
ncbi:hypothetical protein CQA4T8M7_26140 [Sphaerotilus natans]|nr:hypothetical protein CQA4T8M7_26140 [Sphaerotilus natans]